MDQKHLRGLMLHPDHYMEGKVVRYEEEYSRLDCGCSSTRGVITLELSDGSHVRTDAHPHTNHLHWGSWGCGDPNPVREFRRKTLWQAQ